jgi:mono/diheme cytochrome c family protein
MRLVHLLPVLLLVVVGCGDRYEKIIGLQGDLVSGEFLYTGYCTDCHGDAGQGLSGPDLTERLPLLTSTQILEQIETGGNGMPAFDEFEDQELADLLEYLTLTFQ